VAWAVVLRHGFGRLPTICSAKVANGAVIKRSTVASSATGKLINQYKMEKHFELTIGKDRFVPGANSPDAGCLKLLDVSL
jgi:hypothetical protein